MMCPSPICDRENPQMKMVMDIEGPKKKMWRYECWCGCEVTVIL
jgi:hypothetical protein